MLTKDEYVSEMKKRLDEWSREIDTWEVKADEFKEDAKVKYQEQLVALRAKREEGEKKLAELPVRHGNFLGALESRQRECLGGVEGFCEDVPIAF